jgi:LysM repeat protein
VAASHGKSKSAQSGAGEGGGTGHAGVQNVSSAHPEKSEAVQHRVKKGETLYSIARAYGTTVTALKNSNPFLADRPLAAGDVLTIQR